MFHVEVTTNPSARPEGRGFQVVTIDEAREAVEKARKAIAFITRKIKSEKN